MAAPRRLLLGAALLLASCSGGGDDVTAAATTRQATTTTRIVTTTATPTSVLDSTTTTPTAAASTPPPTLPPVTASPATAPPETAPPAPPLPASNPSVQPVTAADLPHSWREGCPVGPEQLRRIVVPYVGFDGAVHTGELIVHADWAEALLGVFAEIHAAGFPIERMESVDNYGASDDASMAANNTSAFNCRPVTGGTSWSRHSYGRAIDINPIQNPYVTEGGTILPPEGAPYAYDRSARPGVITDGDAVVQAFAAIGWQWGGNWSNPKDYQHFDRR